MKNNSLYQQLLENTRFVGWVVHPSEEQDAYWRTWLSENAEHREELLRARATIKAIYGRNAEITDDRISRNVALALEEAKQRELRGHSFAFRPGRVLYFIPWIAAASLLILLGLGWAVFLYNSASPEKIEQYGTSLNPNSKPALTTASTGNAIRHVRLADGSSVVLYKNSRLTYPEQFAGNARTVELSGDAFFEITKDPSKPFYVHAAGIITKVLGTSFSIRSARRNTNVTVLVKTGKVSVYVAKNVNKEDDMPAGNTLVLLPKEQAVYEVSSAHLTKIPTQHAHLLEIPIESLHFNYDHTPISEVFRTIEKAYGVNIRFDQQTFANCSLTAELGDEPLDTKMEWICSILEASYKMTDDEIIITGKPCETF